MEIEVQTRMKDNVTVIDVTGEVDLYTAPRLEEALGRAAAATPPFIIVNLAQTTYLDSTALRVLTAALKRVRERGGSIALAQAQPRIAKLFSLTGLDQVFSLCGTEHEALTAVRAQPQPPA